MSQNTITYEASVYTRTVTYINFKGIKTSVQLYFALDPMQLMQVIASYEPKKDRKSGNPARRGQDMSWSEEDQVRFVRDLADRAAGTPSEDGEVWEPFADFGDSLAGKTFLTKLASSDGDRQEFSQKVILDPFRAFVRFAEADETNTDKDKQQLQQMLSQLENVFLAKPDPEETLEDKRARLAAEMRALEGPAEGTQHPNT